MLSAEKNRLITETGPGTPRGALMRSYWQPAALAEELDGLRPAKRVRLLGEDLVLFRDPSGRYGLLDRRCAHRGADLSFGRCEGGGLRCPFHGWLYDATGACLEQPAEPAGSTFYQKVRQPAYPCVERSGIIWAYMGPGEPPPFPGSTASLRRTAMSSRSRVCGPAIGCRRWRLALTRGTRASCTASSKTRIPPATSMADSSAPQQSAPISQ
jgi:nitrite reductase/ring-hydroxylating ferredoxin subunit